MKLDQEKNQAVFFSDEKNQYDLKLIENPPLHVEKEINNILSKINDLKLKKVVEFGSGTGRLTIPLLKNNFYVKAVDISQESLLKLKKIAYKFKRDKQLETFHTIESIKNTKCIVGCDILHHIELDKYLEIFHQKLEKGGSFVFSEPNSFNIYWLIYISIFANWQVEKGIFQCNYFSLQNKLRRANFKNIKIEGLGLFPSSLITWSKRLLDINIFLGNLPILKYFSVRLIISAEK